MRNTRTHRASSIERLRLAIDCLPSRTREAMLAGVHSNERIIVGAYVDGAGGVCPMLAAHRAGGRTDLLSFAKSWDRFTGARGKSRPATVREISILVGHLEASLATERELDFDSAIREHRELALRSARRRPRVRRSLPADADPAGEITARRLRSKLARALRGDTSESARELSGAAI